MKRMCPASYHHNSSVETYAHLASVKFEDSVCDGSLMTTYLYYYYLCYFTYYTST